jgi:ABC-type Fe3+/spermidine/putrescine transport system ATPase subunit
LLAQLLRSLVRLAHREHDAHLRHEMRDLILTLQRELGITTLIVTHDQNEAVILADQVALIFEGALQQVGEPADFYERPLTEPIARFFGSVNFIPGLKTNGHISTTLGQFAVASAHHMPDGPTKLTIRPENITLNSTPHDTSVPGRILSHLYEGTHTRFWVATADPHLPPLEVIADAASQHHYRNGDTVYLHLPPAKIWAMPSDRDG